MNWSDVPKFVERQRWLKRRKKFMTAGYVLALASLAWSFFDSSNWIMLPLIPAFACFMYVILYIDEKIKVAMKR